MELLSGCRDKDRRAKKTRLEVCVSLDINMVDPLFVQPVFALLFSSNPKLT